ncbi:MAG: stage V sporulation protein SpoVM [Clostridia bacterium]|nr:stage V sporulation protein SpoVM [Clostridia bacterium]
MKIICIKLPKFISFFIKPFLKNKNKEN